MPFDRLCQNPLCQKPFRTTNPTVKCCSRRCSSLSRPPMSTRFWVKMRQCAHGDLCPLCCWEWTASCNKAGYGYFSVKEGDKWVTRLAHRVAWELVNAQPVPDGLQINHHCDNPPCCNPWHLYAGTHATNSLDAQQRGRLATGDRRSHLTRTDVLLIREGYRQGASLPELAKTFHAGAPTIFKIVAGDSWKHLPGALSPEERQALRLSRKQIVSRTRKSTVLTEDKVREIRALAQHGARRFLLAQEFGVSRGTIKDILRRKTWSDIC